MKTFIGMIAAAAATVALPLVSASAALVPGLYNADNLQQICLKSDGTWDSPTFAGWGGRWAVVNKVGHIWGNYASGAGNDSIVVKGKSGSWTEWRDDLSYNNPIDPSTFTLVSKGTCAAASASPNRTANPAQR